MMNVVNSGSSYQIYDEGMKTFKELPPLVYEVHFSKMQGFFLLERPELKVEEERIYGPYVQKVDKVLGGYEAVGRNFGVILSGHKGVGKTLFTKILSRKARERSYPVIIVSSYIPGIAHFISSIDQNVVVLFDEFDKTFAAFDDVKPQEELLTLFDGLDGGHKLFIVTCNKVNSLNDYLVNRPGRFHYHFILGLPGPDEIREYLEDKLAPPYQVFIDDIIKLSAFGKITYDCLRAIAFELNQGFSLTETISDLNISRDTSVIFNIRVEFMDGAVYMLHGEALNLLRAESWGRWFYPSHPDARNESVWIMFYLRDIRPDPDKPGEMYLPVSKIIDCHMDDDLSDEKEQLMQNRIKGGIKSVRFVKDIREGTDSKYLLI